MASVLCKWIFSRLISCLFWIDIPNAEQVISHLTWELVLVLICAGFARRAKLWYVACNHQSTCMIYLTTVANSNMNQSLHIYITQIHAMELNLLNLLVAPAEWLMIVRTLIMLFIFIILRKTKSEIEKCIGKYNTLNNWHMIYWSVGLWAKSL